MASRSLKQITEKMAITANSVYVIILSQRYSKLKVKTSSLKINLNKLNRKCLSLLLIFMQVFINQSMNNID
jgi:hypothetical protein